MSLTDRLALPPGSLYGRLKLFRSDPKQSNALRSNRETETGGAAGKRLHEMDVVLRHVAGLRIPYAGNGWRQFGKTDGGQFALQADAQCLAV